MNPIQSLLPLFRLLQFVCLTPVKISSKQFDISTNTFFNVYSVLNIGIRISILMYTILSDSLFIRTSGTRIIATIDTLLICGVRLLEILILLEAFVKRYHEVRFLESLLQIDAILRNCLHIDLKYKKLQRDGLIKSFIWIGIFLAIEVTIIGLWSKDTTRLYFCLTYLIPFLISSLTYYQIIIYVDLVQHRFKVLKRIISEMDANQQPTNRETGLTPVEPNYCTRKVSNNLFCNDFSGKMHVNFDSAFEEHIFERFAIIRDVYFRLWEETTLINERFQWSMVMNIGNDFLSLLSNFYWLFMCMFHNTICEDMSITGVFMWSIINVLHIFMLSRACHNTACIAASVAYATHHINFVGNSAKLSAFVGKLS